MKKITMFLCTLALLCSVSMVYAQDDTSLGFFDIKLGTADAKAADNYKKFGFNAAMEAGFFLNPYFALSLNPEFTVLKWKFEGKTVTIGGVEQTLGGAEKNAYIIPIFANAKFFIPEDVSGMPFVPYFGGGAGWTIMSFNSDWSNGFAWQVVAGGKFMLPDTNMSILVEAGYRGTVVSREEDSVTYESDMSGVFINGGVSFSF